MAAVILVLSAVLALWASAWIDSLYQREREILTFPLKVRASAFRLPLLILGLGFMSVCLTGAKMEIYELLKRLLLAYFLLMTIVTDLEQHLIFDRMQLPFAVLALPFLFLTGQTGAHLLAALAGGGSFLLLSILMGGAIGGGDIKLMFVLGLWLGGEALLAIAMGGFLLSGLVALVMLGTGRWKRDERFAYSPYFSLMALSLLLLK